MTQQKHGFGDTLRGIGHFLFDKAPGNVPVLPPKQRTIDPFRRDGRAVVAKVRAERSIKEDVARAIALLGPLSKVVSKGDKVLVKPNYNSPDPPPASTDLAFLKAVIELLLEAGATVTVGESSGAIWRPTHNVLRKTGVYDLAKELGIDAIAFDDKGTEWAEVPIDGRHLKSVTIPKAAYEADKLVYLPCLKTHGLAEFSGALKLAFGFVHPGERRFFHRGHLQDKLADVNLWRQPDLVIMDGRKAFISGGPYKGELAHPGLILASGDQVAIDVEAVKVLRAHGATKLPEDPWALPQIRGAGERREYEVVQ